MGVIKKIFKYLLSHKKISGALVLAVITLFFIFRPKPPVQPATQAVKEENLVQEVSVSGDVSATRAANLVFGSSGPVVYLGVKKGDFVKKWQTIATLDLRTVQANLESAALAYKNQQISFDIVNDFNGDRPLSDTGLSVSAFRQLQTALNTLDQAQIAVEIQKLTQQQSAIYAPFDGVITRADVASVGVNAIAATTTFTVTDPTSVVFSMDVDEADIGKIKLGQTVNFSLDSYPDEQLSGKVTNIDFVSHTTTNGANSFTVLVGLPDNSEYKYRVGMNGNADIITGEKDNVLTIPLASLINDNTLYVKVSGKYIKRNVKLGLQNDTDAEVLSGLQKGDAIVIEPSKVK